MYFIFSEEEDRQTNEIIDRLLFHDKEVCRLNDKFSEDEIALLEGQLFKAKKAVGESNTHSNQNIAIFHRRPFHGIVDQLLDKELSEQDIVYPRFSEGSTYFKYLRSNYISHQSRFLDAVLNDPEYTIGKIDYRLNKYEVLVLAEKAGMTVPPTLISGEKDKVKEFFLTHGEDIITKSLYNIIPLSGALEEGFNIKCYTQRIVSLENLPDTFYPTLFQKNIKKKYELRVFYLDKECFAAAILSQDKDRSQQDYRNADRSVPNRIVPYNVSPKLKSQIINLMNSVGLNTGSLDIMMGQDGIPYFLEINPIGQYGWINSACNYGISHALANKMIEFHGE